MARKLNKKKFGKSGSTRQYRSASGKLCFQGVPGKLRETEVYPPEFGRAVLQLQWVGSKTAWVYINTIWRASHKPLMPFLWCPCLRVEKRQPFWHCLEMYFKATYYGHVFWLSFGWHLIWTSMNIQLEQQVPEVPTCCTKVCSTFSRYATPPGGEPLVDGTPDDWNDAR